MIHSINKSQLAHIQKSGRVQSLQNKKLCVWFFVVSDVFRRPRDGIWLNRYKSSIIDVASARKRYSNLLRRLYEPHSDKAWAESICVHLHSGTSFVLVTPFSLFLWLRKCSIGICYSQTRVQQALTNGLVISETFVVFFLKMPYDKKGSITKFN